MSHCSVISPQHQSSTSTTTSPPHTVSDAIPNRSSLFNHSFNSNNVNNITSRDNFESKSQSSAPKINHGKPNLAPKPPPQLSLAMNNNNNNVNISNNSLNDGSRKSVARHQSMKSPRYYANMCAILLFFISLSSVSCAMCLNVNVVIRTNLLNNLI